jgi:hypothetical protein
LTLSPFLYSPTCEIMTVVYSGLGTICSQFELSTSLPFVWSQGQPSQCRRGCRRTPTIVSRSRSDRGSPRRCF